MNLPRLDLCAYVDAKKNKSIVAIRPKPPFRPIFQVAVTKGGSDFRIINEPLRSQSGSPVVFLVETGQGRTLPETRYFLEWLVLY